MTRSTSNKPPAAPAKPRDLLITGFPTDDVLIVEFSAALVVISREALINVMQRFAVQPVRVEDLLAAFPAVARKHFEAATELAVNEAIVAATTPFVPRDKRAKGRQAVKDAIRRAGRRLRGTIRVTRGHPPVADSVCLFVSECFDSQQLQHPAYKEPEVLDLVRNEYVRRGGESLSDKLLRDRRKRGDTLRGVDRETARRPAVRRRPPSAIALASVAQDRSARSSAADPTPSLFRCSHNSLHGCTKIVAQRGPCASCGAGECSVR